jgi:hypothetical protein
MASRSILRVDWLLAKAIFGLQLGGFFPQKTMQIIKFRCDACPKEFTPRDKDGQPSPVGGIRGIVEFPDKSMKGIELDFCPECWKKISDFAMNLNKSKIVK